MKIYRYWAKAKAPVEVANKKWDLECFGGSNSSVEEALQRASERAKSAASVIQRGTKPKHYTYGERPLRELIVKEFEEDGRTVALLTRNSYGSVVLNTPNVLFADIDYPPQGLLSLVRDGVAKLFGRRRSSRDEEIVARIRRVVSEIRDLGLRLYRTSNGFRCLVLSRTFDPTADETTELLREFGSDPLYVRLCQSQECFRARLSPKAWRCGVPRPPSGFPWPDAEAEQRYRQWEMDYEERTAGYTTCVVIGDFGSSNVHPEVDQILQLHDGLACSGDGPLA